MRDRAQVRTRAAIDLERQERRVERDQLDAPDADAPRLELDLLAAPRAHIGRLAAELDRRVRRRHLVDLAQERLERLLDLLARRPGTLALRQLLADNEIDIRMSRLAILHTAWVLDQGARGTTESSLAKVFCSEAIWRTVDRCVQVLGGQGVTGETLVERIFRDTRAFRIYDGPSEVHRWALGARIVAGKM